MKIVFLAGSQLVPVANKRDAAKPAVIRLNEAAKDHHPCEWGSTEGVLQAPFPSTSGVQPHTSAFHEHRSAAADAPESFSHAQFMQDSLLSNISSHLPHTQTLHHHWEHAASQETRRESVGLVAQGL